MIARNRMKIGGKWYKAGEEIPSAGTNPKDDFSQHMSPPKEDKTYTKTDINRMSTSDLKSLAISEGIDGAEDMSGADLKKVLIDKFKL